MVQIVFFIKFQSQLRRTRPVIFDALERTIITSAQLSGGNTRRAFHCIIADFDETTLGFWIDIFSCLETVHKALSKVSSELYGFTCLISRFEDEDIIPFVLRSMPSSGKASGIWCSDFVKNALRYFASFGQSSISARKQTFSEIEKIQFPEAGKQKNSWRARLEETRPYEQGKGVVLLGKAYTGKRNSLRRYCVESGRGFIPLMVSFGTGGAGLSCLINAYTPAVRALFRRHKIKIYEETDVLYEALAKERLREEIPAHNLQKALQFFHLLFTAYCEAAALMKAKPVLILENIERADVHTRNIVIKTCEAAGKQGGALLYGTCSAPEVPAQFEGVFNGRLRDEAAAAAVFKGFNISPSLLEIAYACKLFNKYFPSYIFIELFEEQGKNRTTLKRTLELLFQNNIISSVDNPEINLAHFTEEAEAALGRRGEYIRSLIADILLSHLKRGILSASYNFLEALCELGRAISDETALEAVHADTISGLHVCLDAAIESGSFNEIAAQERAPALIRYYKTLKSLLFAGEPEIMETFRSLKPVNPKNPLYKLRMLTIEASYKIGVHNTAQALEAVKESMLINQNNGGSLKIAHVYRLFSLINLSKKELNDALDYIAFAIDEAQKNGDVYELIASSYYAANIQFIYGNISKAQRLIKRAEKAAVLDGRTGWALRCAFFLGRLHFETGNYKGALALFKTLLEKNGADAGAPFTAAVEAWIFRTELYLYQCMPNKPEVLNADGRLFELEALYLTGNYSKAVKLADHFLHNLPKEKFLFLEQPDWESGFSQCELLEFSQKEFWSRLCTVWKTLSVCRLEKAAGEETIRQMQEITYYERFNDCDPFAPFYFFANYRVLNESKRAEIDKNTAISIAFKRLKHRAGRIDDIEIRRMFLTNQYWNKILFQTAKEYKLI
jgi:tetratricopeptide (TPR) repeat protein